MAEGRVGVLVLVVGPSGAGKDTILAQARAALADQQRFFFPRRVVTRASDASEDHDSSTVDEFAQGEQRGDFALTWRAYGLSYGVPRAILDALGAGRVVAVNVSRAIVDAARERFPRVKVVLVTAAAENLAARLAARGRDPDAAQRLGRHLPPETQFQVDLVVENNGRVEDAAAAFITFLRYGAT